jgi:hypothetical protein
MPLIGPHPVPQFLRTTLGTTSHRYLSTVSLCSSVIGRPWHAALWSSPWRWNSLLCPCGPVILNYPITFYRIEHSLINLFRSYLPFSLMVHGLNSAIAALLALSSFPRCAAAVDFYLQLLLTWLELMTCLLPGAAIFTNRNSVWWEGRN